MAPIIDCHGAAIRSTFVARPPVIITPIIAINDLKTFNLTQTMTLIRTPMFFVNTIIFVPCPLLRYLHHNRLYHYHWPGLSPLLGTLAPSRHPGFGLAPPALPPSLILNQPQYPNHPPSQYPSSICNIQSMINPDIHSYSIHPSIHHTASKLNLDEKEAMICSVWLNSILYFVSASRICVFVSWPNPRACELQLLPTYCASTNDSRVHTILHFLYFDWCFDVLSCIM